MNEEQFKKLMRELYSNNQLFLMPGQNIEEWINETLTKQKLNLPGIGSKRPDCPYCCEPISKEAIERWDDWLKKAKAACASEKGGEKGVRDGLDKQKRYCKDGIRECDCMGLVCSK